jgi:Flp pilus assembly protein TadB
MQDISESDGVYQSELAMACVFRHFWTVVSMLLPALCVVLIGVIAATVVIEYRRWDGRRRRKTALRKLLPEE